MRIKKTSQTTPIQAQVVNTQSNSTTDSYSCDYVNGLQTYSTTETVCGTWLGKPIYRKVFTGTFPSNANSYTIGTITNIKDLINNYGNALIIGSSVNYHTPLNVYVNNNFRSIIQIDASSGQILASFGDTFKSLEFELVVEYTKTTD